MADLSKCVAISIGMVNTRGVMYLSKQLHSLIEDLGAPMPTSVVLKRGRLSACEITESQSFGSYIHGFFQLLGKSYSEYLKSGLNNYSFGCLVRNQNDKPMFDLQGTLVSPVTATSEVIKFVMEVAKKRVKTVDSVILTIPDDFDPSQKEAAMEAVTLAGCKCLFLLPESLAAVMDSIDYSVSTPQVFLVYDFGGESFKADLVLFKNGVLQHLQHLRVASLGGSLLDQKLMDKVLLQFPDILSGNDSEKQKKRVNMLPGICKQSKESCDDDGEITIDLYDIGVDEQVILDYGEVKALCREEVEKTLAAVDKVIQLQYHRLDIDSITKVVMVGGTSLFPLVKEAVGNHFPGRVESKNEPTRIVEGGFNYLMMTQTANPSIQLALGRNVGLGITRDTVHSLFFEDCVPSKRASFVIKIRGPNDQKFKSAIYEIQRKESSKLYNMSECKFIRSLTFALEKRSASNLYKVSFIFKDINTLVFECKNAETEEVVISSRELVFCHVCCVDNTSNNRGSSSRIGTQYFSTHT